ncbi:MAG: M28 family peptidase [Elusimicrobia bacterium]|nr:M28 family peptidase [Elusimicrobiota bacterium]
MRIPLRLLGALLLVPQPAPAQTKAPVVVPVVAQPIAGAASLVAPLLPAQLTLAPAVLAQRNRPLTPTLSPLRGEREIGGRGILARLKSLVPTLAGGAAAQRLDQLYHAAAPAAEPVGAKLGFEDFARAASQVFYEGRLLPGETGAVVLGPRRSRPHGELPGEGEMQRRMELPTLSNPQREEKAVELLRLAGAAPEIVDLPAREAPPLDRGHVILRQDAGAGRHNFIVVKPGRDPSKVYVVGAHHDKVSRGEGKIDNWSGTTLVANLYQALRDADTDATFVFVMFAREEEGLIGSEAFVESLTREQRTRIKAMVNIDTIGVDGTYSWLNYRKASRWLLSLIDRVAQAEGLEHKGEDLWGGDADSSSFYRWTHAMTIYGASQDVIFDIIHSENDNMKAFHLKHYVNTAKLTLALLKALDRETPPPGNGRSVASHTSAGRNGPTGPGSI